MNANSNNSSKQYSVEITTSPDFIQMMGKKLYTNPLSVILVRELLQNSRDATSYPNKGTVKIDVTPDRSTSTMTVVCDDSGCGMDEDTLVNTFLQIGGSKKQDGSVGGFGVAKVSLFATGRWSVHTRDNSVSQDLVYNQVRTRKGTRVVSEIDYSSQSYNMGDHAIKAELFVKSCDVKNVYFNGQKVRAYKAKRLLDIHNGAVISTAPKLLGTANLIFWRIHGLTQYVSRLGYGDDFGFNVVVDFNAIGYKPKDDNYPFDAAREKCKDDYVQAVSQAVAPLVKNVLTSKAKYSVDKPKREFVRHHKSISKPYIVVSGNGKKILPVHRAIWGIWRSTLQAMLVGDVGSNYGMTFDGTTVAEHRTQDGKEYFLVNPEFILNDWIGYNTYNPEDGLALIMQLWHLATHEMTHRTYSDHDENFTSAEHGVAVKTSMLVVAMSKDLKYQARGVVREIAKYNNK